MINIASLYYFTLLQRLSPKYKESLNWVIQNIEKYLTEEWLEVSLQKKSLWEYQLISINIAGVWEIHLFHRNKRQKKLYYYPSFFCDIYIKKQHLQNNESIKKTIFLLSNIFECFDEFDEKNLLIEFHKDIENTLNHDKQYFLRHDFININSLIRLYNEKTISHDIQKFIEKNTKIQNMSTIKNRHPDIYRTLLFFVYNIFALQKSFISTNKELSEIQEFEKNNWENMHVSLSEERLKINQKSLEKTLNIYKQNFENFIAIMIKK